MSSSSSSSSLSKSSLRGSSGGKDFSLASGLSAVTEDSWLVVDPLALGFSEGFVKEGGGVEALVGENG